MDQVRLVALSPRGLTVGGIAVVAIGLAFNWSWLVAVGAAPLVLALAPCAAMCAFGLCMGMGKRSETPSAAPGFVAGAPPGTGARVNGKPS
jgi:hypothetical protein